MLQTPFLAIIGVVKKVLLFWLLFALLVTACRGNSVPPTGAPPLVPSTPTATPIPNTPEATASAFLRAWQRSDAAGMYALLSPASQATSSADAFAARYDLCVQTATVLTATATLLAVLQDGTQAQAAARLSWQTALVGELVTDTLLALSFQGDRWTVEGTGDLIWPGLGEANYLYMEHQIPARANIYDRNGLALATQGTIVSVGVVPGRIEDQQAVLAALSQVTGLSPEEVYARYVNHPAEWWTPIADIPAEVSVGYTALLETPGIEARERDGRAYPDGGAGAHVVGWVAPVPAEDLAAYRARGYRGDEWVGVAGLERWGESYLAGRHGGTLYLMGVDNRIVAVLAGGEAAPGRAIYATLDRALQRQAEDILGSHRGAIVVLDVHNGAVLALASGPTFDNNVFVAPGSTVARSEILLNPDHPLFNRATQGTYPCGSVFKIVTMSAALEAGGMTVESHFYCPGYWDGLGVSYRKACWDTDGHGDINLQDGLTASCDVVFYSLGQALDGIDSNILPTFARGFGLGMATGLEGVAEVDGLVPDPAWKQELYGERWSVGDTVNLAIGQGYLLVTPLQVARMMAAVANGGTLYRPYLVQRIAGSGEAYPEIVTQQQAVGSLPISPEHLASIRQALLGVTSDPLGTATHRFSGLAIAVAGKTGTAEAPGADSMPHSWFAAYAPADAPEIAIVVVVENAGEGSTVAAPMTRQVVEAYYGLPITPLPAEAFTTPTPTLPTP